MLYFYIKQNQNVFLLGEIGLFTYSFAIVLVPYMTGKIINNITEIQEDREKNLHSNSLIFMILGVILAVSGTIRGFCFSILGEKIIF